jgi:hypothetical protein
MMRNVLHRPLYACASVARCFGHIVHKYILMNIAFPSACERPSMLKLHMPSAASIFITPKLFFAFFYRLPLTRDYALCIREYI